MVYYFGKTPQKSLFPRNSNDEREGSSADEAGVDKPAAVVAKVAAIEAEVDTADMMEMSDRSTSN